MKIFSLSFLVLSIILMSFISPVKQKAATPIHFDDATTGSYVFFNPCTNENVDVNFTSNLSIRGSINGQRINFKLHNNEHQQGVGQISGTKYVGHATQLYSENGSLINGAYIFSVSIRVKMIAPGSGNNFTDVVTLQYVFNANGEVTAVRDHESPECQ